jgi:rhodanese-related sulfurtransferase
MYDSTMQQPHESELPLEIAFNEITFCSDTIVIDCRTEEVYESSHLDHSINIPLQHLSIQVDDLPCKQDDSIFIYCRTGNRSATFATYLRSIGYTKCQSIIGGFESWGES